jgi:hypothetical protein
MATVSVPDLEPATSGSVDPHPGTQKLPQKRIFLKEFHVRKDLAADLKATHISMNVLFMC